MYKVHAPFWLAGATRPLLFTSNQVWRGINASLTSLQWCGPEVQVTLESSKGFRRFVVMSADILGITGWIRRHTCSDIQICYEGTEEQMVRFEKLINTWQDQGMIGEIENVPGPVSEGYTRRQNQGFSIHRNRSRTSELTRGRHGVVTGPYSDEMEKYEKTSEYSADSTQSR
jgi:acylphosphatase